MFREKDLLLYKNLPAVVLRIENGKALITLPPKGKAPGETKSIREKDAALLARGPVSGLEEVLRAELPEPETPQEEAAELFAGEHPPFPELASLIWGNLPPEAAWAQWQALSSSPWFRCTSPEEPVCIRSPEEAGEELRAREERQQKEKDREAFFSRLRRAVHERNRDCLLPGDGVFLQDAEALALGQSGKSAALQGAGFRETPEAAHSVLLQCGWWDRRKNPWPARKGLRLTGAAAAVEPPPEEDDRQREDFTHMTALALDNAWSDDPDDAVSFYGGKLWIHIADPAVSVRPDTPADREARARGATLYLPEGTFRMLHADTLSWFALGLTPRSRALSFGIGFSGTGAVQDVEIKRTFVSVRRMSYAEAEAAKDTPELAPLFAIARRNAERRRNAGAVSITLPEVRITVQADAEGVPRVSFFPVVHNEASDMVREMMLLAGEAAARFAFRHGIPFQYISQENPSLPKELPGGPAGEFAKRRHMKARKAGTVPADHAGLGLGIYSQVTSPLRRYGDLAAHQQLRRFLSGSELLSAEDMTLRIAQGDAAQRLCTQAERESRLHWTLNFLLDNPDWQGEAVVLEENGSECPVLVPEFGLETRIARPAGAEPNDRLTVKSGGPDLSLLDPNLYPL